MHLKTERLHLKPIDWDDLDAIHQMNSFPEVERYNTIGIPKDIEQTREMLRPIIEQKESVPEKSYAWAVRLKESGQFVGEIGMNVGSPKYRKSEIYYSFVPAYWGNGYATEGVRQVLKFGFETLNLHRIEAGVATNNTASIALLERVGMLQEGHCREILPIRGQWEDNYMYAILEKDPRP